MKLRRAALVGIIIGVAATPSRAGEYKVVARGMLGGEGRWDLLAVDEAARRLYISRATRVMVVDADTLKLVGEVPDTPGVHVAPEEFKVVQTVKTAPGAKTIAFDPAKHRLYLVTAQFGPPAAATAGAPAPRPQPLPDTVEVIALGR